MPKHLLLLAGLFCLLGGAGVYAQPAAGNPFCAPWQRDDKLTPPKVFEQSLRLLNSRNPAWVLAAILDNSFLKGHKALEAVSEHFGALHAAGGNFLGYDQLSGWRLGGDCSRFLFILRYEQFPVFLQADCYNNGRTTVVTRLALADNPEGLQAADTLGAAAPLAAAK